jgi:RNA polymerase sigma factor (sigma-70 family)
MAAGPDKLLRFIRGLVPPPKSGGVTDAALLSRFIIQRDETAFTTLVARHGPLVLHVCQRILGDSHDAEDAFQAAFLVLARKADTVRRPEALSAWLHGVARRAALKARSAKTRHFRDTEPLVRPAADPRPDPLADLSVRELLVIIDEELERLPERYRLPLILCGLEGRSLEEAARQLGWTRGSVKGRLERGRARLHDRLIRRGLTLSAALAAVEVSRNAASAAVVAQLLIPTIRGAVAFAAGQTAAASGVSAQAAALAGDVLKGVALVKLKVAAGLALVTCLLAAGSLIYGTAQAPRAAAPQVRSSPFPSKDQVALVAPAALVNNRPVARLDEADAPIEVNGRVLDPQGNPLAGAKLYIGYSARRYATDNQLRQTAHPLRKATSGADGRFRFTFARSELDAKLLDSSRPAVVAVASGYGPDWAVVGDSAESVELSLKLVQDLPVNGRILDQNRRPIAGAKTHVDSVLSAPEEDVTRYLAGDRSSWFPKAWLGSLPGQPAILTTDADGRFRVTGVGRDRIVRLALEGPAIQHTVFEVATRLSMLTPDFGGTRGATFDYLASPSRSIRGAVRDKATGRPVAGVKISVQNATSTALTDSDGRFEILGCPKLQPVYFVMAQPETGQPYFAASASVPESNGPDPVTVDFDLVNGIPISGRVTDQSTHKPPKTALVEYYPLFPNPHSSKITIWCNMAASSAFIRPDGSYGLVVLPGPGVLCVAASPRDSYAVAMVNDSELASLFQDRPNHGGSQRPCTDAGAHGSGILHVNKYNALSLIDPDERTEFLALDLTLQPARRLQGTVVGPDEKPLTGVRVIGLTALPEDEMLEGASFTVAGLNPRRSRDLFFHHKGKSLGKFLTIGVNQTEPLTIKLDPCGSVLGRLVDKRGKPIPEVTVCFYPEGKSLDNLAQTDRDGRFRLNLVPGQKYSLGLRSYRRLVRDMGKVEVESGRRKDLGDLILDD